MSDRLERQHTLPFSAYAFSALVLISVFVPDNASGLRAQEKKEPAEKPLVFETDVLPILKARCLGCHSGKQPKAGLDLSRRTAIVKGGESGPAIRIAAAETSLLWEMISSGKMPLKGKPLSKKEKGVIREWINAGAKANSADAGSDSLHDNDEFTNEDRDHWSFKTPVRAPIPKVTRVDRVRNAIDAFVLKRLEAEVLTLSPETGRLVLLRRAYFGLIGLPPTPEEVDEFLSDGRPDAYERLIDRLLASPHYGERWGRHWLDVAGYADTAGVLGSEQPRVHIYRYRDYVVRALNNDKPYDRFLQEQIAGDELHDYWAEFETNDQLSDDVIEGLIATGFLRCAPDASRPDFNTIKNVEALYYYPTIDRTLQIVTSATLGITLQCAKCHSHKFDPIPQREYYRVQSILMTAYRPDNWVPFADRLLHESTKSQQAAAKKHNDQLDAESAALKKDFQNVTEKFADQLFVRRLSEIPADVRGLVDKAFKAKEENLSTEQKQLVKKFEKRLRPIGDEQTKALTETFEDYKKSKQKLDSEVRSRESRKRHFPSIFALYDLPGEAKSPLLIRGDALTPGPLVKPGVLTALQVEKPFAWRQRTPEEGRTSGRRLAFARWMTQPSHPLTPRVMVNRIWMHHFGKGLVMTPEDFGKAGSMPSHPKLLDWLAREFVESGWSIKHMHRLIMTSSTFRQSSRIGSGLHRDGDAPAEPKTPRAARREPRPPDDRSMRAVEVDPANRLLWRQRLQRLEAEPIRDSIMYVAGSLDDQMYGRPTSMARNNATGEVTTADGQNGRRRSIYLQVTRRNPLTMLELFDQPVMETNCTQRSRSTVSLQALAMMNNEFLINAAEACVEGVMAQSADDPIGRAVMLIFSRPVTEAERQQLAEFVEQQTVRYLATNEATESGSPVDMRNSNARRRAVADLCQMLLSANEFVYVD